MARFRSNAAEPERWDVVGYLVNYQFSLYSDFTFFRDHPDTGDMIHQRDSRVLSGGKAQYERDDALGPLRLTTRLGTQARNDRIDNGLEHAPAREWGEPMVDAHVAETGLALLADEEVRWNPYLRTDAGVRVDWMSFDVADALEDRSTLGTRSSGTRSTARVSPKASAIVSPLKGLDLYGNVGLGFHSNDARGVMQGVTPMTQALGYEGGVRTSLMEKVEARVVWFRIDLDSELVWVGDEGTTEPSGRTRREGIEADLRVSFLPWLWSNLSASFTRAFFRDEPAGRNPVPLAPRQILSGSLTALIPRRVWSGAGAVAREIGPPRRTARSRRRASRAWMCAAAIASGATSWRWPWRTC